AIGIQPLRQARGDELTEIGKAPVGDGGGRRGLVVEAAEIVASQVAAEQRCHMARNQEAAMGVVPVERPPLRLVMKGLHAAAPARFAPHDDFPQGTDHWPATPAYREWRSPLRRCWVASLRLAGLTRVRPTAVEMQLMVRLPDCPLVPACFGAVSTRPRNRQRGGATGRRVVVSSGTRWISTLASLSWYSPQSCCTRGGAIESTKDAVRTVMSAVKVILP